MKILYFTASWCKPCLKIAPTFDELSKQYPEHDFVKIDIDENEEMSEDIKVLPTFQFFMDDMKIDEFSGAHVEKLIETVEKYKKDVNENNTI